MLDSLRRSTTNLITWIVLALLALVLGISFGVPTETISFGESPIVYVFGTRIGLQEFRTQFALMSAFGLDPERPEQQQRFREDVLESLVEREVLAEAGEAMGLATSTRDAEDLLVDGHVLFLGDTRLLSNEGFNYAWFKGFVRQMLQTSEKAFIETQRRELQARTVRDLVGASVVVPESEVRRRYEDGANRLSIRYVRYPYQDFATLVDPSDSEIDAWVSTHADELEKAYEVQGSRFVKLPSQRRVWTIAVPKDGGRAPIDEARRRIVAGEDFRVVARSVSTDPSARSGGDLGWVSEKIGTGLDPAVDERLGELEEGVLSDVLEGTQAYYLVRITGAREGDVPKEEALRELAAEAQKTAQGKLLATARAREDLAKIQEGKPVDEITANVGGVHESGTFSKLEPIPALGSSPELVEALWAATPGGPFLDEVYTVGEAAVIAGLESKEAASDEGFAKVRKQLIDQARAAKAFEITAQFARRRCVDAKSSGQIHANDEKVKSVITVDASASEPYSVCDRVGRGGQEEMLRYLSFLRGSG